MWQDLAVVRQKRQHAVPGQFDSPPRLVLVVGDADGQLHTGNVVRGSLDRGKTDSHAIRRDHLHCRRQIRGSVAVHNAAFRLACGAPELSATRVRARYYRGVRNFTRTVKVAAS